LTDNKKTIESQKKKEKRVWGNETIVDVKELKRKFCFVLLEAHL
jgi:hypothetical protein